MKISVTVILLTLSFLSTYAQEGVYAGGGLLFLHAAEEVVSSDGQYNYTTSASFTSRTATFPQAFPNLGVGGYVGYKHIFGKQPNKLRFWAGMELSYNYQNLELVHESEALTSKTKVHYNFGPSIRMGIQKGPLSAYVNVFGFLSQRFDNSNSLVPSGILYDLDDNKENTGPAHPTYNQGVHTGVRSMSLGIAYSLTRQLALRAEYTATKHVEYRNDNGSGLTFDSGLGNYQTMFGVSYYLWSPKKK